MIFAPLRDVITIDSDDDGGDEELDDNDLKPGSDNIAMKQTQFLLGLT